MTVDDVSENAARLYPGASFGDRLQRLRPRICPFEALLPHVPQSSRVLDIGCGSGLFLGLLMLDGRVARGVGVDPSDAAISRALRMRDTLLPEQASALSFTKGGVDALGDARFGVVTMVDVMHHIPPPQQRTAFLGACTAVDSGGVFVYKDLSPRPRWRAAANRAHDLALSHQWVHYVHPASLGEWISASGLTVQGALDLPRLWYAHHALVLRRDA